jgi:hypothetical protein
MRSKSEEPFQKKVNGAQCQQLSLAVLLAWLEPSYQQPMTASLDSDAEVRTALHLPVPSQKPVNFEPAGHSFFLGPTTVQ